MSASSPVIVRFTSASSAPAATVLRLLVLDYLVVGLEGSVMGHFQAGALGRCDLALVIAVLVGFSRGRLVGAIHGLWLGWLTGALMGEPSAIPALLCYLLGVAGGLVRENFVLDSLWLRLWIVLCLILAAELLKTALVLVLYQRFVVAHPELLIGYALVGFIADWVVRRLVR